MTYFASSAGRMPRRGGSRWLLERRAALSSDRLASDAMLALADSSIKDARDAETSVRRQLALYREREVDRGGVVGW